MKDVAKIAGVSTATVSRTLSNPRIVKEETREKVMAAISDTGYITNTLARNFRTRKTNTVVVLVPDISNPFFSNIIHGIEKVAKANDYRVVLGDTQGDREQEKAYANLVQQRQADGIILLGASIPFDCSPLRKSPDPGWPPMVIGCEFFDDFKLPTVRIDNIKAAQDATDHLLELGHRRIAYLNGPKDSPLCKDRFQGYKLSLRKAKLRYDITLLGQGDYSLHSGVKTMKRFLALDVPPTAVFAANDEMAIGAIKAAKEAGLEVPDDLSVAGFDDIRFAEFTDPALTTIHQPRISIGQQVMEVMCKLLRGEKLQDYVTVLPHELVVRESTCLPRRDG
ncbi:MAG: LacI family transcriptional regulator [Gammaproteobacteria bacterium]|nr:LacI family transcriptional regulator [Gammaproteobacteria bacterium]